MAKTANVLRTQVRRQMIAAKKNTRVAKGKVFKGPRMRKLRIRA